MANHKSWSAGGKVMAIIQRKQAESKYLISPNICKHCKKPIQLSPTRKVSDIRRKKFCNKSCAAKYNNHLRPYSPKKISHCNLCGKEVQNKNTVCANCYRQRGSALDNLTKEELFKAKSRHQAHAAIRGLARARFSKERKCIICGYSIFVEICHKKPIEKFPFSSKIKEINDEKNLAALCPNHHYEFDHGLIILP